MKSRLCLLAALPLLCGSTWAQSYASDDGTAEVGYGQSDAWTNEGAYLQAFSVPGGGTDMISNLSVVLTKVATSPNYPIIDGNAIRIAVWSDPNGDQNPSDAVLLGSFAGHTAQYTGTGLFVTYGFPQPIQVQGGFFIGVSVEVNLDYGPIGAVDTSMGFQGDAWHFNNGFSPVDFANLYSNANPPSNAFTFGRYLLRANDGQYGGPLGSDFCDQPATNSTSRKGRLRVNGQVDSNVGPYSVRLTANFLPMGQFGFFLAGQAQATPVTPPGSQGQLCLGGPIYRINPSLASISESTSLVWDVDPSNVDGLGGMGNDVILAGQTWNFQGWHRDDNPGPTSNFTNAVSVVFQ